LEKAKEYLPEKAREYLPGTTETGPSESLLDRAKHTIKQAMPEALGGGYPVQAGIIKDEHGNITSKNTQSILEKGKEKLAQNLPSTSGTTQPGLLELMKQTVTEVIPEMIGLKTIPDEPEIKHDTGKVDSIPQADDDIQQLRVIEEIRTVDMDKSGNVTQIETQQNVSHIPVRVKDILVEPEQTQKVEDLPLNEQPIVDRPLADNYEFQGQSIPAPTSQKVTIPSPQIMISPDVQQQQYQESFH
jgi:hypothetical protein